MARRFTLLLTVVLLAGIPGFGQIVPGVGYPGGGYPGGGYPGRRYPQGGQGGPGGQGQGRGRADNPPAKNTLTGIVRSIEEKNIVIESDDKSITTISIAHSTKYVGTSGSSAKIGDFQPGDHVSIAAKRDAKSVYHGETVTMVREGTGEEHAIASQSMNDTSHPLPAIAGNSPGNAPSKPSGDSAPAPSKSSSNSSSSNSSSNNDGDRPKLRRAASSSDDTASSPSNNTSSNNTSSGNASSVPDPDRPRMRRAPASSGDTSSSPPSSASSSPPSSSDGDHPRLRRAPASSGDSASSPSSSAPSSPSSSSDDDHPRLRRGPSSSDDTPKARSAPGDDPFIDQARDAASAFSETLPNYVVKQFTTRYATGAARGGKTSWQVLDNVTADVIEENGDEKYKNILVNGKPPTQDVEKTGSWSRGEFSSLLQDVLSPLTNADFHGKRATTIVNREAFRYDFSVEQPNSHWHVESEAQSYLPAYTGAIWIDKQNYRVLRIELSAQKHAARRFRLTPWNRRSITIMCSSARASICCPIHSEALSCGRGTSTCTRNVIEFRNYKKFTADTSITFDDK